jgi:hypothetical protein
MAEAGLPLALRERLAGELDALTLRAPEPHLARYRREPSATRHGPALGPMVAAGAALALIALFAVSPGHAPFKLAVQIVSHLDRTHGTDQAPAPPVTGHPAKTENQGGQQGASSDGQMEQPGTGAGSGSAPAGLAPAGLAPAEPAQERSQEREQEKADETEPGHGSRSVPTPRSTQPREGSDREAGKPSGEGD